MTRNERIRSKERMPCACSWRRRACSFMASSFVTHILSSTRHSRPQNTRHTSTIHNRLATVSIRHRLLSITHPGVVTSVSRCGQSWLAAAAWTCCSENGMNLAGRGTFQICRLRWPRMTYIFMSCMHWGLCLVEMVMLCVQCKSRENIAILYVIL